MQRRLDHSLEFRASGRLDCLHLCFQTATAPCSLCGSGALCQSSIDLSFTRRRSPRPFDVVAKKNGEVVGWGIYETTADGKILTITSAEQRIVLEHV